MPRAPPHSVTTVPLSIVQVRATSADFVLPSPHVIKRVFRMPVKKRSKTSPESAQLATPSTSLTDVHFGREWLQSPLAPQVVQDMPGFRALGTATATSPAGALTGLLLRHIQNKSYRLVTLDATIDLDHAHTEAFLKQRRVGHHGGPGRAQGPLSSDGRAYTQRVCVTIPVAVVDAIVDYGHGALSLGVRRLAAAIAKRLHDKGLPEYTLLTQRWENSPLGDSPSAEPRVYLDPASAHTLRQLGQGNLSRGIRLATLVVKPRG